MVRSIQISSLKILDPNRHNLGESDRALVMQMVPLKQSQALKMV